MSNYQVVVPVSGGKDSQACLKLALSAYPRDAILGLFCDTNFEHYLTYAHVDWMKDFYGVQIETICAGSVEERVVKAGRFPSGIARFCTMYLKIYPSRDYYRMLATQQGAGFEVWYGMRSAESHERAIRYRNKIGEDCYPPHEFMPGKYPKLLHKLGVSIRLPLLDWSTEDVLEYLNGEQNPLYRAGMGRVGCFPCLAAGDQAKINAFELDWFGASQLQKVRALEGKIGKSVFRAKIGARYTAEEQARDDADAGGAGCSFCAI